MNSRRRRLEQISGGLNPAQIKALPPEVRAARAAYLSDTTADLGSMFASGVTEFSGDSGGSRKTASLDAMLEAGYQVDSDHNVYSPNGDDWADD